MVENNRHLVHSDFEGIKVIFIDLDDTLWWFSENTKTALRHVYDQYRFSRFCDYATFNSVYERRNAELWHLYHYGKIERNYLLRERFEYTLRQIGDIDEASGSLPDEINEEYLRYLATLPTTLPGAEECLQYLTQHYPVHILSNGFKGVQAQKLRSAGIEKYITSLVLSDDCGITKPLRGIFDYALNQIGAKAEEVVMIGDNYDADICGAHNAGWRTIYFNWRHTEHPQGTPAATAVINNLSELEKVL